MFFFRPKTGDLQKKKVFAEIQTLFWPKSEIYGFFRPKTGDLKKIKKKDLRRNSNAFSGRTQKFMVSFRPKTGDLKKKGLRRKVDVDQKQEGQKRKVFFLLHYYFRGIWCCIRPNFMGLCPLINQRSNPDGGTRPPRLAYNLSTGHTPDVTLT